MVSSALLKARGFLEGRLAPLGADVVFVSAEEGSRYFVPEHLLPGGEQSLPWSAIAEGHCEILAWARVCDDVAPAPEHLHSYIHGTVETSGFQYEVLWREPLPGQTEADVRGHSQRIASEQGQQPPGSFTDAAEQSDYVEGAASESADDDSIPYSDTRPEFADEVGAEYVDIPARAVDEWVLQHAKSTYYQAYLSTAALLGEAIAPTPLPDSPVQTWFDERPRMAMPPVTPRAVFREVAENNQEIAAVRRELDELASAMQEQLEMARENNWAVNTLLSTKAQERRHLAIKWSMAAVSALCVAALILQPLMTSGVVLRDWLVDTSVWLEDIDRWMPFDWPREKGK